MCSINKRTCLCTALSLLTCSSSLLLTYLQVARFRLHDVFQVQTTHTTGWSLAAAPCRFEGNAEEIRSEVHAMQQQVRVLAGEKEDLHHQMHSEQQRSRQHLAQVINTDPYYQSFVFIQCQDSQVVILAADM